MGIRLLLANKESRTTEIFREAAPSIGADLFVFESLQPATRSIRDEKFDAIFVDAQLPGLTRWEFTRLVRKSKFNSQAPIILLTGYDKAEQSPSEESENISLMVKPSTPIGLLPFLKQLKRKLVAERRKQRRMPFRTDVAGTAGLRRFRAHSVNLSTLGMLMEGNLFFRLGDEFEVQFQLDAEAPLFRNRVRVIRVDGPKRVGVAFQALSTPERQRLREFINRHLSPIK